MLLGEQQDSSYVRLVMVKGVQLRRGHVERTVLGEAVIQGLVQRQQVHVVHGQVVRVVPALQVAHVDQRGSVESGRTKTRGVGGRETAACRSRGSRKEAVSPVVIHLVDDEDLVADLLLVEEAVHEGDEDQQLLEAFSEGDDHGQLVRTPGGVVQRRRLSFSSAGRRALLGEELGAVLA